MKINSIILLVSFTLIGCASKNSTPYVKVTEPRPIKRVPPPPAPPLPEIEEGDEMIQPLIQPLPAPFEKSWP